MPSEAVRDIDEEERNREKGERLGREWNSGEEKGARIRGWRARE